MRYYPGHRRLWSWMERGGCLLSLFLTLRAVLRAIRAGLRGPAFRALLSLVLLAGIVFYRFVEGWTWVASPGFSLTTLTTVGLGDLVPSLGIPKSLTIVLGIGILVGSRQRAARDVLHMDPMRRSVAAHPGQPGTCGRP